MRAAPVIWLTVASLAVVLGAQTEDVKTDAAAAHHRRPWPGQYPYFQPLVQDRYVCDLDASVLLVVDSNRHHHRHASSYYGGGANRAVRVKCSEVANNDEDSCNLCCQQTARRDTTLANDQLFGFLAITKTKDDETFTRSKRQAEDEGDEEERDEEERDRDGRRRGGFHRVDPNYVVEAQWKPSDYNTNVKCVCCAPRTSPPAQSPPSYGNTAAASPPASSTYGSGSNTFSAPPQPVQQAAQAPAAFVDSWQSDSASSWGAAQDAAAPASAPAATPAPGNTY